MANYQTTQRKILLEFLQSNPDVSFSAKEIFEKLSDATISLSAIYRNLASLEGDGEISRLIKEGSREGFYQYINSDLCRNSIHLICTNCNKTFHLEPNEMKRMVQGIQKSQGFVVNNAKTILYGTCKHCK